MCALSVQCVYVLSKCARIVSARFCPGTATGGILYATKTQVQRVVFTSLRSVGRNILSPPITRLTQDYGNGLGFIMYFFFLFFLPVPTTGFVFKMHNITNVRGHLLRVSRTHTFPFYTAPDGQRQQQQTRKAVHSPAEKTDSSQSMPRTKKEKNHCSTPGPGVPGNRQGFSNGILHVPHHSRVLSLCTGDYFSSRPVNRIYVL